MFNFLKPGIEFNNLAKSMGSMYVMIQDLIPRIENSYDMSEFTEEVLVLAYISKKGVFDRIEKYNWAMDSKISIPPIDNRRITLAYAMMQTVTKVSIIAAELEITDLVQEVFEGGEAYQILERNLPDHLKNNI
jgi:hypothetical protein